MLTVKKIDRAVEINKLHSQFYEGLRTTLQFAIKAGELLVAQKRECGHGNWIPWIEANLKFSRVTAFKYMRCYYQRERLSNVKGTKHLTIEDIARVSAKPSKEETAEQGLAEKERQIKLYEKLMRVTEEKIKELKEEDTVS